MSAVAEAPTSALLESVLTKVAELSREEKIWLVARIEADLSQDITVPAWHLEVLDEREREGEEGALPLEAAFRSIREELQRDRNTRK
ncbi:MAG TPA: addiction module protein [Prosthecobacter sp.]|nr:addiction module protein [Prosthecobacter sp.]